jgi:hypothetical protein
MSIGSIDVGNIFASSARKVEVKQGRSSLPFWVVCADKTPYGDMANTSATSATVKQLMAPGCR